jgi:molybdopterin synthase catalytic subunit
MIKLSKKPIQLSQVINSVENAESGAINVFVGTVRNQTKEKKVLRLEFESYEKMALNEMKKICETAIKKWPINKISIVHAVGLLNIGDVPVVIAVSAPHRKASFEACEFVIDELKKTVPIWKREIFEDGEVWVSAHP